MAVRTGVMGSSEPALVFPVVAFHCSLQELQTLKTKNIYIFFWGGGVGMGTPPPECTVFSELMYLFSSRTEVNYTC